MPRVVLVGRGLHQHVARDAAVPHLEEVAGALKWHLVFVRSRPQRLDLGPRPYGHDEADVRLTLEPALEDALMVWLRGADHDCARSFPHSLHAIRKAPCGGVLQFVKECSQGSLVGPAPFEEQAVVTNQPVVVPHNGRSRVLVEQAVHGVPDPPGGARAGDTGQHGCFHVGDALKQGAKEAADEHVTVLLMWVIRETDVWVKGEQLHAVVQVLEPRITQGPGECSALWFLLQITPRVVIA
mmetsp:Transcript_10262/g.21995  ORF Transcript_10262/g.21995 Transcript_10262/m.21995 type:complete len:240 (+) Transcript_10262:1470-2189(+)